jgi:ABC-2 type transport system permease protein
MISNIKKIYTLYQKELLHLLGSLIAYLVIAIFLILSAVFTWFFRGNTFDNQYADLQVFFNIAPYLFLFIIPAMTMHSFADERKQGTLEKLYTLPISIGHVIFAKYLAVCSLIILCIIPTLSYYYTIYSLAYPVGNIDTGAYWGSLLGLFLMASSLAAMGIFTSSLTKNQIIAFLLALVLGLLFWMGWEEIGVYFTLQNSFFFYLSLRENYVSISRGMLHWNEAIYFLFLSLSWLWFSKWILYFHRH